MKEQFCCSSIMKMAILVLFRMASSRELVRSRRSLIELNSEMSRIAAKKTNSPWDWINCSETETS